MVDVDHSPVPHIVHQSGRRAGGGRGILRRTRSGSRLRRYRRLTGVRNLGRCGVGVQNPEAQRLLFGIAGGVVIGTPVRGAGIDPQITGGAVAVLGGQITGLPKSPDRGSLANPDTVVLVFRDVNVQISAAGLKGVAALHGCDGPPVVRTASGSGQRGAVDYADIAQRLGKRSLPCRWQDIGYVPLGHGDGDSVVRGNLLQRHLGPGSGGGILRKCPKGKHGKGYCDYEQT